MPYPATPGPGEGESSTISPVLPSANAYTSSRDSSSSSSSSSDVAASSSSSSRILPPSRDSSLSVRELQSRADSYSHEVAAGAQVDLRVEELRRQEQQLLASSSSSPSSSSASSTSRNSKQKQDLTPPKGWSHFVAGGVGGMCGAIITSPLDVVKTRLQSNLFQHQVARSSASSSTAAAAASSSSSQGVFATAKRLTYHFVETGQLLKDISVKEGPRALFKGLGPTLVGVVPARAINFFTYGNGKILLAEQFNSGKETPLVHLAAAALAGITTATATNPIWVVKTRLQLESHEIERQARDSRASAVQSRISTTAAAAGEATRTGYSASQQTRSYSASPSRLRPSSTARSLPLAGEAGNFFRPARSPPHPGTSSMTMLARIVKQEGVRGLYRGMSASYLGVAEGTIQWVLYERLKRWSAPPQGGVTSINSSSSSSSTSQTQNRLSATIGSAGVAKLVASLITYPHEVLRTRLRQGNKAGEPPKYTGLLQTIKLVWKEEGAAALYGGLSAHLLRVVPNAAVMFSIYELTLRLAAQSNQHPPPSSSSSSSSQQQEEQQTATGR